MRNLLRAAYRRLIPLVNQRSRYRLFLNSTIATLNRKSAELAAATDHFSTDVRAIPITAPFGNSMLVLAPHQDDEAIGCGGAMALQAAAGKPVAVVILQDGAAEHQALGLSRQQLTDIRNEESRRAAAVIGMEAPVCLNYASLVESHQEAVAQVRALITARKVDAVFAPFLLDNHPDHRSTNEILADALREVPWPVRVFGYEVWGLVIPNVLVVIDEVIDRKLEMLRCFTYANRAVDYVHTTQGLNMYRSRLLGAGICKFAECFFEMPNDEFMSLMHISRDAGGRNCDA